MGKEGRDGRRASEREAALPGDLRSGPSCPPSAHSSPLRESSATGVCRQGPSLPHDIKTPLLLPFRREGKYGPVEMENFNFPLCSLSLSFLPLSLSFYIGPRAERATQSPEPLLLSGDSFLDDGGTYDDSRKELPSTQAKRTKERKKEGRNFASPPPTFSSTKVESSLWYQLTESERCSDSSPRRRLWSGDPFARSLLFLAAFSA